MRKTYTTQVRVLLCQSCGAPLEVGEAGGAITCSYCQAQNQVQRRNPTAFGIPAPSMPIDEDERLRRLRSQDGQPLVPPESLRYLIGVSGIQPARVNEALHIFQSTKKEVEATHSPDAAERLYFLALMLNTHLGINNDDVRRRALLETTLETVTLPRHIQVMRSLLASASAKEGDIASAEQWLAHCDPRSDVLEADSAFRAARAFVDTARNDFHRVVQTLGAQDEAYPIADSWDPTCAVLRANALEKTGQVEAAAEALRQRMAREGHSGRTMISKVIDAHPRLALCAQSFPIALAGHTQLAARRASQGVGGGIGSLFFWLGMFLTVGGTAIAVVLAVVGAGMFAAGITWVSIAPTGLIFAVIGWAFRKKAREAAWLRENGIVCTGIVRGHSPTGTRINGVPMVRVDVEVNHPNMQAYAASFKQLLSASLQPVLQPGTEVPLRVHPEQPTTILLEMS